MMFWMKTNEKKNIAYITCILYNYMYSIFLIGPYEWYIGLHLPLTYEPLMSYIPIQTINM